MCLLAKKTSRNIHKHSRIQLKPNRDLRIVTIPFFGEIVLSGYSDILILMQLYVQKQTL